LTEYVSIAALSSDDDGRCVQRSNASRSERGSGHGPDAPVAVPIRVDTDV
jgi:hypothetical protein